MQNDHSRLKIHTAARPVQAEGTIQPDAEPEKKEQEEIRPAPCETSRTKRCAAKKKSVGNVRRTDERMTVGEKLIRNTAIACALLLTAMAVKNVDHPWTQKAAEGIRQAMTMRVDWDETLGRLSFVRALVPDTALVFLNLGQNGVLSAPVSGTVSHAFTGQQPWIEYRCEEPQAVFAAMDGRITAVGEGMNGDWTVLTEDEAGRETVTGYLSNVYVEVGQTVKAGQQIGQTGDRLYFELREDGEPADPSGRMR